MHGNIRIQWKVGIQIWVRWLGTPQVITSYGVGKRLKLLGVQVLIVNATPWQVLAASVA